MAWKNQKKKTWVKKHIWPIVIGGIILALWLGGIFAQVSVMMFRDEPFSAWPWDAIAANFTVGPQGLIFVLFLSAALGAYIYLRRRDKMLLDKDEDERGFNRDGSGVHGTSTLLGPEEIKDFCEVEPLKRTQGIILGKLVTDGDKKGTDHIVSIPHDGCRYKYDTMGRMATTVGEDGKRRPVRERFPANANRHIMVIGTSGCGKSWCFARPAIFQAIARRESMIVTDPKGELYGDTAKYAEDHGYIVKILNLSYLQGSDSWDALAELKGAPQIGIEAMNFCNIIISNTSNPNARADEVYANGEKNLLTALVLYVLTSPHYAGPKTLGGVYNILCKSEEELVDMFNALPADNIARSPWEIFRTASDALRGNLKLGLGVRLQTLQDEVVQTVTGVPDIDLTLPGKVPCVYYVIMPVMNNPYTFISSLFFSCLFDKLFDYAQRMQNRKLPVEVNVIMDEFIAIGALPDFEHKLATVRSAGISIAMIFQNLPQLQNAYPDGTWESLIANCYTFLCLSCNDLTTAKYISERGGTSTVALEQKRVSRPVVSLLNVPTQIQHSYSVGEREVMQPAEVITLSHEGKNIVSIAGADLFICDKFGYNEMLDPSTLAILNMYDHTPAWTIQKASTPLVQPTLDFFGDGGVNEGYHRRFEASPVDDTSDSPDVDLDTPTPPGEAPKKRIAPASHLAADSMDCSSF